LQERIDWVVESEGETFVELLLKIEELTYKGVVGILAFVNLLP
jgi:hypothetical protein